MRRRVIGFPVALIAAAALALSVVGSAQAAWYTFDVDNDSFFDVHFIGAEAGVVAKPSYGGWMNVLVEGDGCCGDGTEDWELIVRRQNQVVYDGPCVAVSGFDDMYSLGANIRIHGARLYTLEFHDCSPGTTGDNHIDEVRIISTSRTWTVVDVFG
jgi:hypothetical protein